MGSPGKAGSKILRNLMISEHKENIIVKQSPLSTISGSGGANGMFGEAALLDPKAQSAALDFAGIAARRIPFA